MEHESLLESFPRLRELMGVEELRHLLVIDPNIEEEADEADIFDPTEYNWMLFFPERVREGLGEELFALLPERLERVEIFQDLIEDGEGDLFGFWCEECDEERIARAALEVLDSLAAVVPQKESEA
ncbi:hypothetical protein [Nitratifractor sp.]